MACQSEPIEKLNQILKDYEIYKDSQSTSLQLENLVDETIDFDESDSEDELDLDLVEFEKRRSIEDRTFNEIPKNQTN